QILPKPPKTPLNRPHALLFGVLRLYRQDFPNETSPHFFLIAFGCVREREGKVLKNELIFQGRSLNAKTRRQINGSQSFKLLFSSSLRYFLRVLGGSPSLLLGSPCAPEIGQCSIPLGRR